MNRCRAGDEDHGERLIQLVRAQAELSMVMMPELSNSKEDLQMLGGRGGTGEGEAFEERTCDKKESVVD